MSAVDVEAALQAPPKQEELDAKYAMGLAKHWYSAYGPFRGQGYTMRPLKAWPNAPAQWSIKYKVVPDTGSLYFFRFHYTRSDDGTSWEVEKWTEDPELPDSADFDPDDFDEEDDDLETLNEEEGLAEEGQEGEEVSALEAEAEMSIEELMALYGREAPAYAVGPSSAVDEPHPSEGDNGTESSSGGSSRRRKRRRASAVAAEEMSKRIREGKDQEPIGDQSEAQHSLVPKNSEGVIADSGEPLHDDGDFDASDAENNDDFDVQRHYNKLTVLNYFNPAFHQEEVEIEVGIAEKKSSRIGPQYQADVPTEVGGEPTSVDGELQWQPPPPTVSISVNIQEYCEHRASGALKPGHLIELALKQLYACGYETKSGDCESVNERKESVADESPPWNLTEIAQFEDGLLQNGKDFLAISNVIENRSRGDVVQFYYDWKTTEMYDAFVACSGGFKGKIRRKHLFEPGRPVSDFAKFATSSNNEIKSEEIPPALED